MPRKTQLLCLFLMSMLMGCGGAPVEKTYSVSGTITDNGDPLQVAGADIGVGMVQVLFYLQKPDGTQAEEWESAKVDAAGKFTLLGKDGRGIKPGKYRIAVRQWDPYPQTDKLGGMFDEKNSPIIRDISENTTIEIDLAKVSAP